MGATFSIRLVSVMLLAACGGGGGPAIDATRAWLQALSEFNFDQVMNLTCADKQVRSDIQQRLAPFNDISKAVTSLNGKFDFSGLKFEEKSNNGQTAMVHLSGSLALTALGQSQSLELNEEIQVVNEGGDWKVCGNPLGK